MISEPTLKKQMISEPTLKKQMISEPTITKQMISEPTITKQMISEPTITKQMISEPTLLKERISEPLPVKQTISEPSQASIMVTESSFTSQTVTEPSFNNQTVTDTLPSAEEKADTTDSPAANRDVSPKEPSRHSRERRMRRSLEHHNVSQESITEALTSQTKNGHGRNLNLREPQGIPGRSAALRSRHQAAAAAAEEEEPAQEYNPLRRLRDSQVPVVMTRRTSRGETQNGMSRAEKIRRPNLNPSFLPRFRDGAGQGDGGATTTTQVGVAEPQRRVPLHHHQGDTDGADEDSCAVNSLPLPPRQSQRPSTLQHKPRERKYPMGVDVDSEGVSWNNQDVVCVDSDDSLHSSSDTSRSSCERMLSSNNNNNNGVAKFMANAPSRYCIENIDVTAEALGLGDPSDLFWSKTVSFAESAVHDGGPDSLNVSYEDLLEFALDHGEEMDGKQICDALQTMRSLFSEEQVSTQHCVEALNETDHDVQKAVKLVKLKQLMSTQLGDAQSCKQALLRCDYNVHEAANYIFTSPPSQMSPDCVDV